MNRNVKLTAWIAAISCALAAAAGGVASTSPGQRGYEGQPGNQGNGQRGYEGQPGNQGGGGGMPNGLKGYEGQPGNQGRH